jgi:hypothetical protein
MLQQRSVHTPQQILTNQEVNAPPTVSSYPQQIPKILVSSATTWITTLLATMSEHLSVHPSFAKFTNLMTQLVRVESFLLSERGCGSSSEYHISITYSGKSPSINHHILFHKSAVLQICHIFLDLKWSQLDTSLLRKKFRNNQ